MDLRILQTFGVGIAVAFVSTLIGAVVGLFSSMVFEILFGFSHYDTAPHLATYGGRIGAVIGFVIGFTAWVKR